MKEKKILVRGAGASKGIAAGKVRVVTSADEFDDFKEGEILVTKITDPSYVVIMAKSAAIVTDMGGILSHPAIVSREFGIPCVVGTGNATAVLKNGQEITVDGGEGVVYEIAQ